MINFLRLGRSRPAARPRSASPNLVGAGGLALSSSLRRARTAGQVTITGVVRAREARIQLRIRGPRRREQEVEAVIAADKIDEARVPLVQSESQSVVWHCLYTTGRL